MGLVLSGGSARGMAHLGVLNVLEEHGVPIDLIVGASFGSMAGGYYTRGYSIPELHRMMKRFRIRDVLDLSRPWFRILSAEKAGVILRRDLDDISIEELKIPLYILAADICSGEMVVFDRGNLVDAMLASSAFPGLFEPFVYGERLLIDGGILNRMMVNIARERGADLVIYSDVSAFTTLNRKRWARKLYAGIIHHVKKKREKLDQKLTRINLRYVIFRALCIILDHWQQHELFKKYPPDYTIVSRVGDIRPLQFNRMEEVYRLGREAALEKVDAIREEVLGT